jgi:hypothetical protein
MTGTEKTIDQFGGWDNASQQHDFFGETNLVEDVITAVEKDDIATENTTTKGNKKEEAEKELEEQKLIDAQFASFSGTSSEEDEDEDDDPTALTGKSKEGSEETIKVTPKSTLSFLKDKGLVEYEEDPEKPLTEEEAENLLEDSWEAAVEKEVEETIKDLPNELKQLIKYAAQGGNVGELLGKMAKQATLGLTKDSDIDSEATQILAVSMDLAEQGYDQEYIDTQIEFLKEKEKLEGVAKKAFDKIISKQEEETTQEIQRQKNSAEHRKKAAREYKVNITSHIGALEEVQGLPISKQDKTVLPTYISEPSVELQDGRLVSEMQADLFKVMADKDKIVLLAKLLKTDFDFSAIERKKQTQAARGIKEEIQRADKNSTVRNSTDGGHKPQKKAIWDMID